MPYHLEYEALQSYDSWYEEHEVELTKVEMYWTQRVELVTALKEGAVVPSFREEFEMALRPDPRGDDEAETLAPRARRGWATS